MIIDPHNIRLLSQQVGTTSDDVFEQKLIELHAAHQMNKSNMVVIPTFWCETVLYGIQEMIEEVPHVKFSSAFEFKNRLRLFTLPASAVLEELKVKLYNKIDTLTLEAVETLLKSPKKPFFMI